jgi:hypothetical protein
VCKIELRAIRKLHDDHSEQLIASKIAETVGSQAAGRIAEPTETTPLLL